MFVLPILVGRSLFSHTFPPRFACWCSCYACNFISTIYLFSVPLNCNNFHWISFTNFPIFSPHTTTAMMNDCAWIGRKILVQRRGTPCDDWNTRQTNINGKRLDRGKPGYCCGKNALFCVFSSFLYSMGNTMTAKIMIINKNHHKNALLYKYNDCLHVRIYRRIN